MSDRKFTDDEVIKALECFAINKDFDSSQCIGCAFETKGICYQNMSEEIANLSLALINRQKAEIERLEHIRADLSKEIEKLTIDMNAARLGMIAEHERLLAARAEAIKEFCKERGIEYVENDIRKI